MQHAAWIQHAAPKTLSCSRAGYAALRLVERLPTSETRKMAVANACCVGLGTARNKILAPAPELNNCVAYASLFYFYGFLPVFTSPQARVPFAMFGNKYDSKKDCNTFQCCPVTVPTLSLCLGFEAPRAAQTLQFNARNILACSLSRLRRKRAQLPSSDLRS